MKKLKWGVLSCADIGLRAIVPALQQARNCEVVAISSRDPERARRAAADRGILRAYGDYTAVLADPEVEAVYVPLPNSLHTEWCVRAAEHSKHVLCEKPLALSVAEVDAIAVAASHHGVLAMEAMMYRLHPQTAKVMEIVRSGALGAVEMVSAMFTYHVPNPHDIRLKGSLGGGVLADVGCYCVSVARMVMEGEPVEAMGRARFGPNSDVDEVFAGLLRFSGGRVATFGCALHAPRQQEYHITGTEASLTVTVPFAPGVDDRVLVVRRGWQRGKETEERIVVPGVDQYRLLVEHFADCVMAGAQPLLPLTESRANTAVVGELRKNAQID